LIFGAGEEMNNEEEEKEEESEKKEDKKIYTKTAQILDESFKKAESLKIGKPEKKEIRTIVKKPFNKIGIFIIIIAIICLIIINFVPFMYIYYETDYESIKEYFSYEDLKYNQFESGKINSLFESNCLNCSDNSESYTGLTVNDFSDTPKITNYILYITIIVGAIFTIFIIFDRKKEFSENTNIFINSVFTTFIILIGIIILLMNIKFLDAYLLQQLNKPFIAALGFNRVQLIFFVPYVLILFSFVLFIVGIIFMRVNLNKAVNRYFYDTSQTNNHNYRFGSKV
jgi:hypothetical protein